MRKQGRETDEDDARMLRVLAVENSLAHAVHSRSRPGAGLAEMSQSLVRLRSISQGLGPKIAHIFTDPAVTDVLINSTQVWVDRGRGLERSVVDIGDERDVKRLAIHMAAACGNRLDDASPIVDGTLPGGIRLHAVLPPLSSSGTVISLRVSGRVDLSIDQLERAGSCTPRVARVLRGLVARRANVVISGATGSGKTTLLSALLALVPADQRILCIEEVSELHPVHPHVVHLCERRANVQGLGAVTLSDLVRAAMRMRPDRLVLGECRGPEVRDVMTALNTGHQGGWATIHANSAQDVPARLLALGALAGMRESEVTAQAVAAFNAVVHLERRALRSGESGPGRWVAQVGVFRRDGDRLICSPVLDVSSDGTETCGLGWPRFAALFLSEPVPGSCSEGVLPPSSPSSSPVPSSCGEVADEHSR
ncbi:TadA family conjugal transfer-associated ATPase [Schaalia sp. ZJ1691]|uniref:TadA family conjugal transfer-associated ATPase n=1 Tax=Schaalia sp. ZJ1691 TaxID=2709404 RepID=UPI001F14F5BF|nr:TadA family conjugal transfer-associated ATPase [Schaalia sp. ZJ1691]